MTSTGMSTQQFGRGAILALSLSLGVRKRGRGSFFGARARDSRPHPSERDSSQRERERERENPVSRERALSLARRLSLCARVAQGPLRRIAVRLGETHPCLARETVRREKEKLIVAPSKRSRTVEIFTRRLQKASAQVAPGPLFVQARCGEEGGRRCLSIWVRRVSRGFGLFESVLESHVTCAPSFELWIVLYRT